MEEFKLTEKERISYILQLEILSALQPNSIYETLSKALRKGFTLHYKDLKQTLLNKELSIDNCKLVLDILEMYNCIILSAGEGVDKNRIRFPGFDCNDPLEAQMYSYARYFMEDLDRYDDIKKISNGSYNSHCSMLPKYNRMLQIWNALDAISKRMLPQEILNKILNA